jgi:hypothetical protein
MVDGSSMSVRAAIEEGRTALGIEFGSISIKAVLIGEDNALLATAATTGRTSSWIAPGLLAALGRRNPPSEQSRCSNASRSRRSHREPRSSP